MGVRSAIRPAQRILTSWIAGIAGAALGVALLVHFGLESVLSLLARAGFGLVPLFAFHFIQLWLTALAWRALMPSNAGRPSQFDVTVLRWIREGVNSLLPVAQMGGLVAAIRLLTKRGLSLADAVAATLVDVSVEMVTQVAFTLLGLALLIGANDAQQLAAPLMIGFAIFLGMVAALLGAQWLGLARFAERAAARFGWQTIEGLHEAIMAIYRRRAALGLSALWHLAAWGLGTIEIFWGLHLLGRDAGLYESLIIESLGQTIRTAGFFIPGALGVQEGGYILLCGLLGISPDLALALSLVRRLRDIVLGMPSIAVWSRMER